MRREIPNVEITKCFLHRSKGNVLGALTPRTFPLDMTKSFENCVKVMNLIHDCSLNYRTFQSLCEEVRNTLHWCSTVSELALMCACAIFCNASGNSAAFPWTGTRTGWIFWSVRFVQILNCLADALTTLKELSRSLQEWVSSLCDNQLLYSKKSSFVNSGNNSRRVKGGKLVIFTLFEGITTEDFFFYLRQCRQFKSNNKFEKNNSYIRTSLPSYIRTLFP